MVLVGNFRVFWRPLTSTSAPSSSLDRAPRSSPSRCPALNVSWPTPVPSTISWSPTVSCSLKIDQSSIYFAWTLGDDGNCWAWIKDVLFSLLWETLLGPYQRSHKKYNFCQAKSQVANQFQVVTSTGFELSRSRILSRPSSRWTQQWPSTCFRNGTTREDEVKFFFVNRRNLSIFYVRNYLCTYCHERAIAQNFVWYHFWLV